MSAGRLNHKISFQSRIIISDGYGNERGDFSEVFIRSAEIKPALGIEQNAAARLVGEQPVEIRVYRDSDTKTIDASWRAVDVNDGTVYAITSPTIDLKQDRRMLWMTAVAGRAA